MQIACKKTIKANYLTNIKMYRYVIEGVSVVATLDTRRKKNDNTYPIKIQVVYKRKQTYYNTYQSLTKNDWVQILKSRKNYLSETREVIGNKFLSIKQAVKDISERGDFSFNKLDCYLGKYSNRTINEALRSKIDYLYENNRINSYYNYRSALHALERFAGENISISEITPEWLKRCETYWLNEGLSPSSMSFYFRDLKSVINTAIKDGIISSKHYPFGVGKYEIPKGVGRKMALNIKEIKSLAEYNCKTEKIRLYRDLWLFSYLCNGINFKDMLFLKRTDIVNGEIGFIRDKTARSTSYSRMIYAAVTKKMVEIMDRWGQNNNTPYIFPFATGNETEIDKIRIVKNTIAQCNKIINIISADIGINKKITTYSARHSFATVLKREGVSVSYISECLGHSNTKITETYLDSFEYEERKKNSKLLTNY